MASPVFFIKKKDGTLCLVQDYQVLNAKTCKGDLQALAHSSDLAKGDPKVSIKY